MELETPWKIGQIVWIIETIENKDKSLTFVPTENEITAWSFQMGKGQTQLLAAPYGWCLARDVFTSEEAAEKRALELVEQAKLGIKVVADPI